MLLPFHSFWASPHRGNSLVALKFVVLGLSRRDYTASEVANTIDSLKPNLNSKVKDERLQRIMEG